MMAQRLPAETAADERHARKLVRLRDGEMCVRCMRDPGTNWDHRKNRSVGGRWEVQNGQMLCGSGTTGCHGWVTSHPEEACREGWACPSWYRPEEYPARRWVRTKVGTMRLAQVLYLPADQWDDGPGWVEIGEMEAATRRAGLWKPEEEA
jgi:hypothetical protein